MSCCVKYDPTVLLSLSVFLPGTLPSVGPVEWSGADKESVLVITTTNQASTCMAEFINCSN